MLSDIEQQYFDVWVQQYFHTAELDIQNMQIAFKYGWLDARAYLMHCSNETWIAAYNAGNKSQEASGIELYPRFYNTYYEEDEK